MTRRHMITAELILGLVLAGATAGAAPAQAPPEARASMDRASVAGSSTSVSMFSAIVVDQASRLPNSADVKVTLEGVRLVEPTVSKEEPRNGEGHLQYRVDQGPVISTTATRLSLHELTPGAHIITVQLVGNDHQPLAPAQTLTAQIPGR